MRLVKLILFCSTFAFLTAAGFFCRAPLSVAEEVYKVHNQSRNVFYSTLQAAMDDARPGEFLKILAPGTVFPENITWIADNLTLDLNGSSICPAAGSAINFAGNVTKATLINSRPEDGLYEISGDVGITAGGGEFILDRVSIKASSKAIGINGGGSLNYQGGNIKSAGGGIEIGQAGDFSLRLRNVAFDVAGGIGLNLSAMIDSSVQVEVYGCTFLTGGRSSLRVAGDRVQVLIENCAFSSSNQNETAFLVSISGRAGSATLAANDFQTLAQQTAFLNGLSEIELIDNWVRPALGGQSKIPNYVFQAEAIPGGSIIAENNLIESPAGVTAAFLKAPGGQVKAVGNQIGPPRYGSIYQGLEVETATALVEDNALKGVIGTGLYLKGLTSCEGKNNYVDNSLTNAQGTGLKIVSSSGVRISGGGLAHTSTGVYIDASEVEVEGLEITGAARRGIYSSNSELVLQDAFVQGPTPEGSGLEGILTDGGSILVEASRISGFRKGISLNSCAFTLQRNTITGNTTGIYLTGTARGSLQGNLIKGNETGVDLAGFAPGNLNLHGNDIYGNSALGLSNKSAASVDLNLNYWGKISGPYHAELNPDGKGNAAEGEMVLFPWATSGFSCDAEGPWVKLLSPATGILVQGPVDIKVSTGDDAWIDHVALEILGPDGRLEFSRVLEEEPWEFTWDNTGWADGRYILKAKAQDAAGNIAMDAVELLLDRQPPQNTMIKINGGARYTTELEVELSLAAEDMAGVESVIISNSPDFSHAAWGTFVSVRTWELAAGPDGPRQVYARFRDPAGNISAVAEAEIRVDRTPPATPGLISPGPDEMLADLLPHFQWQEVNDFSGVSYCLELSQGANFSQPLVSLTTDQAEYTLNAIKLEKGKIYYWRVCAVDGAGHRSGWAVRSFKTSFSENHPRRDKSEPSDSEAAELPKLYLVPAPLVKLLPFLYGYNYLALPQILYILLK
ncbi:MAG: hypothetical protein PWP65_153 [Clostridia bacterium]|nr:hypothetical protein [Clostridia bacterium]